MSAILLKLPDFEGPLELLYALVQRKEIDISTLSLTDIVDQIQRNLGEKLENLDLSAESISQAGNLLLLKSKALLPIEDAADLVQEDESEFQVALLEKLVEYCRFKEAAKELCSREEKAKESYFRSQEPPLDLKKPLGLEHLCIEDLASIFQGLLAKAKIGVIDEEKWSVADKMQIIKSVLQNNNPIAFSELASSDCSKLELIVYFLAMLELMKLGIIQVAIHVESKQMMILPS